MKRRPINWKRSSQRHNENCCPFVAQSRKRSQVVTRDTRKTHQKHKSCKTYVVRENVGISITTGSQSRGQGFDPPMLHHEETHRFQWFCGFFFSPEAGQLKRIVARLLSRSRFFTVFARAMCKMCKMKVKFSKHPLWHFTFKIHKMHRPHFAELFLVCIKGSPRRSSPSLSVVRKVGGGFVAFGKCFFCLPPSVAPPSQENDHTGGFRRGVQLRSPDSLTGTVPHPLQWLQNIPVCEYRRGDSGGRQRREKGSPATLDE